MTDKLKVFRQPLALGADRERVGEVSAEQLARINALPQVLRPLAAEEVIVRGMYLANTLPMHNYLQFAPDVPAAMEPMCVGKPVMRNHDTYSGDALPVARMFDARTLSRGEGDPWLAADFYLLNNDRGRSFADDIDGGLLAEVSPTVLYRSLVCSICGEDDLRCEHAPGKEYNGRLCTAVMGDIVDMVEASFAWAGMQRDTGFYLAAGRPVEAVDTVTMLSQRLRGDAKVSAFLRWWQRGR